MAGPTPPRTPTARKSLQGSPPAKMQNIPASASPISFQKRRWQGDSLSLPLQGLLQPESAGLGAPFAHSTPTKRQRLTEESKSQSLIISKQHQYYATPPSPPRHQTHVQMPSDMPSQPPAPPQASRIDQQLESAKKIFLAAFQRNTEVRMPDLGQTPVTSMRIDRIAHAMWDVVFQEENMMSQVTIKASMFPQIKLRALAKLNYLPSWWLLREMACAVMMHHRWIVDDSDMQKLWANTLEWCKRVEVKVGMQGDGVASVMKEVREGLSVQQHSMKAED